jgi:hypothetical protein
MASELAADAAATRIRIDEQRFHAAVGDPHESERPVAASTASSNGAVGRKPATSTSRA